jgi:hypothetical protein
MAGCLDSLCQLLRSSKLSRRELYAASCCSIQEKLDRTVERDFIGKHAFLIALLTPRRSLLSLEMRHRARDR